MIYFDNAATTHPKPRSVINSLGTAVTLYGGNPGRSGHRISMKTAEKVYDTRKQAADFFGAEPERIVFTYNCTHSLNMAIKGILTEEQNDTAIKKKHIIISGLEHNSVLRPVHAMTRYGYSYDIAPACKGGNGEEFTNSLMRLIRPQTKLIVCTHVSNVTGDIFPVKEIGRICREMNIFFIVDAAQSAGILPIKIKEDNIDILCTAGHKGLYGITGTGLMAIGERVKKPGTIIEGGSGSVSYDIEAPDFYPDRFENGTIGTVGIAALSEGFKFVIRKGLENIYRHEYNLCRLLFDKLKNTEKAVLYSNEFEFMKKCPVVPFNIKNYSSMETAEYLNKKGFALRGGFHCSPLAHKYLETTEIGTARFSPSVFNKKSEVLELVEVIKKM